MEGYDSLRFEGARHLERERQRDREICSKTSSLTEILAEKACKLEKLLKSVYCVYLFDFLALAVLSDFALSTKSR